MDHLEVFTNIPGIFKRAYLGDCVFNTRLKDRYAPVMHQISGCVTCRSGELCVVVRR